MNLLLASVDAAGKLEALTTQFGIEGKYLLMQIISFSVVAFVLYRFFFKPVLATVEERQRKIEAGLAYADEMKAKLEQAQRESEEIVRRAAQEAQGIVNEARRAAKELAERQNQETTAQASAMLEKAQQAIELERKKMLSEVRGEIARLVTLTASKVLASELSPEERNRYAQAAARELANV
jgi:F-type H+-transporting ATPase subunit b